MTLPEQIRSVRHLAERLPAPEKGRLVDAVRRYAREEPDDRLRYRVTGDTVRRWRVKAWPNLFVRTLSDGKSMVVEYRSGVAWLYRGRLEVERDLLGPHTVALRDELRFSVPIFSRFKVDTQNQLAQYDDAGAMPDDDAGAMPGIR